MTYAQGRYSDVPRFEVGAQFDFNYLDGVNVWGGGLGFRFNYNFTEHLALDSSLTYRQHDLLAGTPSALVTPAIGQTNALFGARVGQRVDQYSFFAHARGGFMHFGSSEGVTLLTKNIVPAFDVGGTLDRRQGEFCRAFATGGRVRSRQSRGAPPRIKPVG